MEATGKEFVSTRWILTNQGDRQRWKTLLQPPTRWNHCGTLRLCSKRTGGEFNIQMLVIGKILVVDVSRAHFSPKCRRGLCTRLRDDNKPKYVEDC